MESFFKGVLTTLSFLLILTFCFYDGLKNIESPRPAVSPSAPSIKSVQFEQAPAVVSLGGNRNENKFNWKN